MEAGAFGKRTQTTCGALKEEDRENKFPNLILFQPPMSSAFHSMTSIHSSQLETNELRSPFMKLTEVSSLEDRAG